MSIDQTEIWEKWQEKAASVTCLACGLGENFFYWFDWDRKLHQAAYKQSHRRRIIQTVDEITKNEANQLDEIFNAFDEMHSNTLSLKKNLLKVNKTFASDLESPITPSDYVENFK